MKEPMAGMLWTAIAGDGSYSGICEDNVVVFYDSKKNIAYSLVDLGDGPVIMSYDNSVTKFFWHFPADEREDQSIFI